MHVASLMTDELNLKPYIEIQSKDKNVPIPSELFNFVLFIYIWRNFLHMLCQLWFVQQFNYEESMFFYIWNLKCFMTYDLCTFLGCSYGFKDCN